MTHIYKARIQPNSKFKQVYIQKFLISPNAFKGTFNAKEVAASMQKGVLRLHPQSQCILLPVADGGDGTLSIISSVLEGEIHTIKAPGPLCDYIDASWFASTDQSTAKTAIIELAQASGISHLTKLDAMAANTAGTGVLINDAFLKGYKNFILTVGGSASTDGGTGILSALGARFFDKQNQELRPCGTSLRDIASIDLSSINKDLLDCKFTIACDVENPLYGPTGAAHIFAPQKGATPKQVLELDQGLQNLAAVLNPNLAYLKGAGAAGGVPYAMCSVFGAKIISGFEWIVKIFDLENKIKEADIILTGEGSLDEQSIHGKAVGKILDLCLKHKKQLWIFPAVKNPSGYDFINSKATVFPIQKEPGQKVYLQDIEEAVASACL